MMIPDLPVKNFVLFLILLSVFGCADDMLDPVDSVEIRSVTPDTEIADGDLVNFTLEVFYNLATHKTGTLLIGFSTSRPNSMSIDTNTIIKVSNSRGVQRFDFGRTVEKMGTEPFSIFAVLAEHPYTNENFRPLSIYKYTIITTD